MPEVGVWGGATEAVGVVSLMEYVGQGKVLGEEEGSRSTGAGVRNKVCVVGFQGRVLE